MGYPIDTNSDLDTDLAFQQFLSRLLGYTNGRPHATTTEFAHFIAKAQQTIRKNYCLTGDAFGVPEFDSLIPTFFRKRTNGAAFVRF